MDKDGITPQRKSSTLVLMLTLICAVLAYQLNASMLSPALVTMQQELRTSAEAISMTQTIFFSVAALGSLFVPRLADLVGRSKLMCVLLLAAAAGSVLTALAPNVAILIIGRLIMGISGPIVALCMIVLRVETPDARKYGALLGILASVNGGIAGVDALLGGWLTTTFGFRSLFWTMATVCLIAAILVARFIRNSVSDYRPPMDWTGVFWLVICIGALLSAINEIQNLMQANWLVVAALILLTLVAGMVFWRVENQKNDPLIPPNLAKTRATWALPLTTILTMVGIFAVLNGLLPALGQDHEIGPGMSPAIVSWYTLTPYSIAGLIVGPIAGTLAGRIGFLTILRTGQLATLGSLLLCALGTSHASGYVLFSVSALGGVTYQGMCNPTLNGIGVLLSPKESPGYLPGINSAGFNIGAGLSFAVLYGIFGSVTKSSGTTSGFTTAFLVGAGIMGISLFASLLIPGFEHKQQTEAKIPLTH